MRLCAIASVSMRPGVGKHAARSAGACRRLLERRLLGVTLRNASPTLRLNGKAAATGSALRARPAHAGPHWAGQIKDRSHGHYWSWSWISAIDAAVLKRSACLTNSPGASADAWEVRNLRSRRVIRMILISLGLGEASRNGQPFRSA